MKHRAAFVLTVAMALTAASCATTDSPLPQSRELFAPVDRVWFAVIDALHDMDARIVSENRTGGMVFARLEAPDVGGVVTLDVTFRKWMDGTQVRVGARLPGATTDPDVQAHLRQLEDDLLDRIQEISRRYTNRPEVR